MKYIIAVGSALSQLVNTVLLGGHPNESISGRCYREPWPRAMRVINAVFFWQEDHCKDAYLSDLLWAHQYLRTRQK